MMALVLPTHAAAAEDSDAVVVSRAKEGERAAQALLYRRHVRMVRGLAYRLLGQRDVEDVVQDAFVTAFERLGSLRDGQAFARWLGTIVVFTARKAIRQRRRSRTHSDALLTSLVSEDAPAEVRAELEAVYSILAELPDDVRIALVLRRVEGLSIKEISAFMGRSIATVKRRISDGDFHLKAAMKRGQS
jgi:RNA polymerase sigma-70 factor (ECF subfamily)